MTVLLVLLVTLILGLGLKVTHSLLLSGMTDTKKSIEPSVTAEMCSLWEIRQTEQRMIDAGVITHYDMSVCYDEDCPNCAGTRKFKKDTRDALDRRAAVERSAKSAVEFRKEKALSARYKSDKYRGYTDKDIEFQKYIRNVSQRLATGKELTESYDTDLRVPLSKRCKVCGILNQDATCRPCRKKQAARAEAVETRNRSRGNRFKLIGPESNPLRVNIPNNVPSFAQVAYTYKRGGEVISLEWSWKYDDNGKTYYFRQNVPCEVFEESYGADNVIHHKITDPDTGEHLGYVGVNQDTQEAKVCVFPRSHGLIGQCDCHSGEVANLIKRRINKLHQGEYDALTVKQMELLHIPMTEILKRIKNKPPVPPEGSAGCSKAI